MSEDAGVKSLVPEDIEVSGLALESNNLHSTESEVGCSCKAEQED